MHPPRLAFCFLSLPLTWYFIRLIMHWTFLGSIPSPLVDVFLTPGDLDSGWAVGGAEGDATALPRGPIKDPHGRGQLLEDRSRPGSPQPCVSYTYCQSLRPRRFFDWDLASNLSHRAWQAPQYLLAIPVGSTCWRPLRHRDVQSATQHPQE